MFCFVIFALSSACVHEEKSCINSVHCCTEPTEAYRKYLNTCTVNFWIHPKVNINFVVMSFRYKKKNPRKKRILSYCTEPKEPYRKYPNTCTVNFRKHPKVNNNLIVLSFRYKKNDPIKN